MPTRGLGGLSRALERAWTRARRRARVSGLARERERASERDSGGRRTMTRASDDGDRLVPWTRDRYGGVVVDVDHAAFVEAASTTETFDAALGRWTTRWRAEGARGVWLRVGLEKSELVSVARDRGFEFHHAEKTYVMMTTWLPEDEASTIPANASHQVGVGAFVWDEERKRVLLVQEKRGPASGRDLWKMPTGLVDAGEDVPDAAVREVLEETGIETTFEAVVGVRHGHFGLFGKSDLFFCVVLRVKPESTREIVTQESEIEAAKWASLDDFLDNPHVDRGSHAHELHERCARWASGERTAGIVAKRLPIGFGRPGEVYTYVTDDA